MDSGARSGPRLWRIPAGLAALIAMALFSTSGLTAAGAGADPTDPAQPPSSATAEAAPASEVAPATEVAPSAAMAATADPVPHLPSPDNLPPGTTQTAPERRTLGYLRDIWNTARTEDVTMSDMLLLIAQRPMSTGAGDSKSGAEDSGTGIVATGAEPATGPPAPTAESTQADPP